MLLLGVVLTLAVLVGGMSYQNLKVPSDLGLKNGHLAALPSTPNGVSSQAQDESKRVAPLVFKGDLQQTQLAALAALAKMGNNQIISRTEQYVHVVFFTPSLRFRDDVELYFDQAQQQIHFRSQSRVGYSDRGVNRERYHQYAKLYAQQ